MVKLEILKAFFSVPQIHLIQAQKDVAVKSILEFRIHNRSHATVEGKNGTNKRIYKRS